MNEMVYVIKADGRKQIFKKSKVIRTCLRLGATEKEARIVADKVEKEIYDGIKTKKILKLIFKHLKEFKPALKHQIDLRESVCLLRPKPDFELFVARLLEEYGYEVKTNQIIFGKCIEHEIDVIARKGKETIYVEVKHHINPHTFTGLDVFLKTYATFLDLIEGYKKGITKIKFDKAMVVCSTKISEHALKYANCKGILYIAWKVPYGKSLENLIENKKLYPITLLKNLELSEQDKLINANFILLKDLIETDFEKLKEKTKLKRKRLEELINTARKILS